MTGEKTLQIKEVTHDLTIHEQAMILAVSHLVPIQRGIVVMVGVYPFVVWNNGTHILVLKWDGPDKHPSPGTIVDMQDQNTELLESLNVPKGAMLN